MSIKSGVRVYVTVNATGASLTLTGGVVVVSVVAVVDG